MPTCWLNFYASIFCNCLLLYLSYSTNRIPARYMGCIIKYFWQIQTLAYTAANLMWRPMP